jgi:cell wall-associated NlpC family hydrolase
MRFPLVPAVLASALWAAGCASTGAVPTPFPRPAGSAPGSPPASPVGPAPAPAWPEPSEPLAGPPAGRDAVATTALSYRGVRYRTGGNDPEGGFDCSGFVWYVFAREGIAVPRTVAEQYTVGARVSAEDARPGDLVFFNTTGNSPSHVGIWIGGDEFVHAPSGSGEVRVERLGSRYWSDRFVGIRRVD